MRDLLQPKPLEFEEARSIVIGKLKELQVQRAREVLPLERVHGRFLAETVSADRDYPALRRSLRDGFAVKASDTPGTLRIRGEVRAGDQAEAPLAAGEALEIMTGAPVPDGADAVVMVEHVEGGGRGFEAGGHTGSATEVRIERLVEKGQFINERGAEIQAGSTLLRDGLQIDASHVATLATVGKGAVSVYRRPRVAILATGDEIIGLERQPEPHQIRNSNSYMLAALVRGAGGDPTILPVAGDTRAALRPLLEQGLAHDMLVVSGGVSAGRYDLVKPTLRELGVEFHFERVRVQPGQPTAFGTLGSTPVFGLPGNPGSSLITFSLFARPAVEILAGNPEPLLPLLTAEFEAPFRHKLGLTRFLPACLHRDGRHLRHIPWQGSSDIPALARANVLLVADHDRESWAVGDSIRVMLKP